MRIQQLELQPLNKYTIVLIPTLLQSNLKETKFSLDKIKMSQNASKPYLMNTILWNCRGMNQPNFCMAFKELVDYHKPVIVVLTETKIDHTRLPTYLPNLSFPNHDLVDAQGSSGSILVLWIDDIQSEVLGLTFQEFHLKDKVKNSFPFLLSTVYTMSVTYAKSILWKNLLYLRNLHNLPWFVAGDFNKISSIDEKSGGRPVSFNKCLTFTPNLEKCNLIDLGYKCPFFTWSNKRLTN